MQNLPVLLVNYNRPDFTNRNLKNLKKLNIKNIHVFVDGPKNSEDLIKNAQIKKIIKKFKVKKIKANKFNSGRKRGNIQAIMWFFKLNKYGVVLEDDCIPTKEFFYFCNVMLKKYKNNKKIFSISGSDFSNSNNNDNAYFSKYFHCWGWASWSNKINKIGNQNVNWIKFKNTKRWRGSHKNLFERYYWEDIFNKVFKNKIDSWAYLWQLKVWKNNYTNIIPPYSLVNNIGQKKSETLKHLVNYKHIYNKTKDKKLIFINENKNFDKNIFKNHYGLNKLKIFYIFIKTLINKI